MQLKHYIPISIKLYIKQVEDGSYQYPDYSACCPLCNGVDCPIPLKPYHRKCVIINYITYYNFPIIRLLCCMKGDILPKDRTFSLLPSMLTPYRQSDLKMMHDTLKFSHKTGKTFQQTKLHISNMGIQTDIPLENKQIRDFKTIFSAAFFKLNAVPELKKKIKQIDCFDSSDPIGTVLRFIEHYRSSLSVITSMKTANVEKLAIEYFISFQSGNLIDRYFLFGTPSQHQ